MLSVKQSDIKLVLKIALLNTQHYNTGVFESLENIYIYIYVYNNLQLFSSLSVTILDIDHLK